MIKSFVPIKSYHSLIISLLVVVTITAMFLLADEILLAGLNKKYILVSALLILAISFSTLIFRSYAFYKDLQLFLPDLWTSKLLSASTEYMIADDIGKVFLKSSDSIIDFCKLIYLHVVRHSCALIFVGRASLMIDNHPPYIPAAF